MVAIDPRHDQLWRAAINSALGPLSTYLTPVNYGVSTIRLASNPSSDDDFLAQIRARLDLGRAIRVAEIVGALANQMPSSYRHRIHYSEDRIDGVLVVPRLLREMANGRRRIPVLRASHFSETPEALLASELLRISTKVARAWESSRGAERDLAAALARSLSELEGSPPWNTLVHRPRPSLFALASSVKNRSIAGWTQVGGPFDSLAELVLSEGGTVTADAGPVVFPISVDARYADRIFELICLGWLLAGLKRVDARGKVRPQALQASSQPIFAGMCQGTAIELYYQAGHLSASARYHWNKTGAKLRAIPDYSLELSRNGTRSSIILDAKNRGASSRSEIVYKMLGYRENLALAPYYGIGLAPEYSHSLSIDRLSYSDRFVTVWKVPLANGRRLFETLVPRYLQAFINETF